MPKPKINRDITIPSVPTASQSPQPFAFSVPPHHQSPTSRTLQNTQTAILPILTNRLCPSVQQFQRSNRDYIIQMQKRQSNQQQIFLPSHLLDDDDDQPTTSSIKNAQMHEKEFAFSAPPILFNLGYRIEEDFFDEGQKTWAVSQFNSSSKLDLKQKTCEVTEFQLQINNTRKLSLQNEEEYLSYERYQNINMPPISYFPIYSPQEEILNNLHYVSEWCRDQYGSRNIQTALESGNDFLKGKIFEYLYLHISQLIYDKFGNYVVQKYLEVGSERQKEYIYELAKKEFLFICLHSYGCRVIQKIVEYAADKEHIQTEVMKIIEHNTLQVIMSQNGNHIIQKLLEVFNRESTERLSNLLLANIEKLSFHSFGCRVVQKYLQCGRNEGIRLQMMEILIGMTLRLSKCQYGNYIMQYIVTNTYEFEAQVLKIFEENFVHLSCNKFASNVIEKVIKSSKKSFSEEMITKLTTSQDLIVIAKHQFGNYVIQSLLDRSSIEKKMLLKAKLKENCQEISKSQYGRHVLMQMEKAK